MDSETLSDSTTESSVESSKFRPLLWAQDDSISRITKDASVSNNRYKDLFISRGRSGKRPEQSLGKRALEAKVCCPRGASILKGKTRQEDSNIEVRLDYLNDKVGRKEESDGYASSDVFPTLPCRYSGKRRSGVVSKLRDRNQDLRDSLTLELMKKLKERRTRILMEELCGETKKSVSKKADNSVLTPLISPGVDVKESDEETTTTDISLPPPVSRFLPDGYNSVTHLFTNPGFISFQTEVDSLPNQPARINVGSLASQLDQADVSSLPNQILQKDMSALPSQLAQHTYQTSSDESSSSHSPIGPSGLFSKPERALGRPTTQRRGGFRRWRSKMDDNLEGGKEVFLRKSDRERKKSKFSFKRSYLYRSLPQSYSKNWSLRKTEPLHERNRLETTTTPEWSDVIVQMQRLGIGTMKFSLYEGLESISLCHSNLKRFPDHLFEIKNLRFLDVSWNSLSELPTNLNRIPRLEFLDASHNRIKAVIDVTQSMALRRLNFSFNAIEHFPQLGPCINFLNLTENQIWHLPNFKDAKKVTDFGVHGNEQENIRNPPTTAVPLTALKLVKNRLTGCYSFATFKDVIELDVSGNGITYLDVSTLLSLARINCSNNTIVTISLHGANIQTLIASKNCLTSVRVKSHPRKLRYLDLSRNSLGSIPPWLVSCDAVEYCDVSSNGLVNLPAYVTSGHLSLLKILKANSNRLKSVSTSDALPDHHLSEFERERICRLENLSVHHNQIDRLSENFFQNFPRFCFSCESLEELVVSGNNISDLPDAITKLQRLRVLRIYLNPLRRLPQLSLLPRLQVIDVSHCLLSNVDVRGLVGPRLASLDVAFNRSVGLDPRQLSKFRCVNVVDTTGMKDKSLPVETHFLQSGETSTCNFQGSNERGGVSAKTKRDGRVPWKIGFSEASGKGEIRLTTTQLRLADLHRDGQTCLMSVMDGGPNLTASEVMETFRVTLHEEELCYSDVNEALKFAVLSSLRQMAMEKGVLVDGFCAAYLTKEGPRNMADTLDFDTRFYQPNHHCSLRLCYFGNIVTIVTTSQGPPLVYSFPTQNKMEDSSQKSWVGKNCNGDMLCNLPDPQTKYLRITPHHVSIIIASASLWEFIEPPEANQICQSISDPTLAAKRFLTLAQSYGCDQQLSILVLYLPPMYERKLPNLTTKLGINQHGDEPRKTPTAQFLYSTKQTKQLTKFETEPFTDHSTKITHTDGLDQSSLDEKVSDEDSVNDELMEVRNQWELKPRGVEKITEIFQGPVDKHVQKETSSETQRTVDLPMVEYLNSKNKSDTLKHSLFPLIPPPAGFRDSDCESIASDSGFSGNSGDKICINPTKGNASNQVQSTNTDYIPKRNSLVDYFPKINSLKESRENLMKSSSVPNLLGHLSSDEMFTEYALNCDEKSSDKLATHSKMPRYFYNKNICRFRRSWLYNQSDKFFHNAANFMNALKIGSISRFCYKPYNCKRFGSLQNLTHYQNTEFWNNKSNFSWQITSQDSELNEEMFENFSPNLMGLESTTLYWNSGITCF